MSSSVKRRSLVIPDPSFFDSWPTAEVSPLARAFTRHRTTEKNQGDCRTPNFSFSLRRPGFEPGRPPSNRCRLHSEGRASSLALPKQPEPAHKRKGPPEGGPPLESEFASSSPPPASPPAPCAASRC